MLGRFTVLLCCFAVQLFLNCWLDWSRSGCRYTPGAPVTTGRLGAVQAECQITALYMQWEGACVCVGEGDLPRACQSAEPLHKSSPAAAAAGAGQRCAPVKMHQFFFFPSNRCVLPPECFSASLESIIPTNHQCSLNLFVVQNDQFSQIKMLTHCRNYEQMSC